MMKNKNITNYSEKFIHYYSDHIPEKIKELLENFRFTKIADIGCGDGALLYSLKTNNYFEKFEKIYALDVSSLRLERVKNIDEKITVIHDDISILNNLNILEKVDFIICNQVIEHVSDDEKAIKNMSAFLKPGALCQENCV
ncbi:class I SAM-dependent methyltransferase [Thermospira aquatica]|uniref:Class I SAM-dependent methyltransferase n=1 Tax=Thermospira aquatica TaxID=2828656 RepID=A0AAX3BGC3_9SPIR|nr:class I SAM-dependent methyltransferase [Thermospira aquatica]URA11271.1 class I SAM-dependent methyltransferase [Thermospira aquatica]